MKPSCRPIFPPRSWSGKRREAGGEEGIFSQELGGYLPNRKRGCSWNGRMDCREMRGFRNWIVGFVHYNTPISGLTAGHLFSIVALCEDSDALFSAGDAGHGRHRFFANTIAADRAVAAVFQWSSIVTSRRDFAERHHAGVCRAKSRR